MDETTEFEAVFFALDAEGRAFLLETGRSLVRRTEGRKQQSPKRAHLSLVPPRLLELDEDGVDSAVELVPDPIIGEPEGGE